MRRAIHIGPLLLALLLAGMRLHAQSPGSLDTTWGTAGWLRLDLGQDERCNRLLAADDGGFILLGSLSRYDSAADMDFFVAKLRADGQLDPAFGNGGVVSGDFGGHRNSRIVDADLRDGALYLVGEGSDLGTLDSQDVYVGKLDLSGQWVADFAEDGLFHRRFVGSYAAAGAVQAMPDGSVWYCGATSDTSAWHVELPMVGRLGADGRPDSSLGGTGTVVWRHASGLFPARVAHNDGGKWLALQADETGCLLGGYFFAGATPSALLLRVDAQGRLDTTFGQGGWLLPDLNPGLGAVILDIVPHDGGWAMAVEAPAYLAGEDMGLLRCGATGGQMDFGDIDVQGNEDRAQAVCADPQGRVYLAGYSRDPGHDSPGWESDGLAVACVGAGGLEAAFGDAGTALLPPSAGREAGATAIAATASRQLMVAGYVGDTAVGNYTDIVVCRLHADFAVARPEPTDPSSPVAFPNPIPSGHVLHFSSRLSGPVKLYDPLGHAWDCAWDADGMSCTLPPLPAGVYFLLTSSGSMRLVVR